MLVWLPLCCSIIVDVVRSVSASASVGFHLNRVSCNLVIQQYVTGNIVNIFKGILMDSSSYTETHTHLRHRTSFVHFSISLKRKPFEGSGVRENGGLSPRCHIIYDFFSTFNKALVELSGKTLRVPVRLSPRCRRRQAWQNSRQAVSFGASGAENPSFIPMSTTTNALWLMKTDSHTNLSLKARAIFFSVFDSFNCEREYYICCVRIFCIQQHFFVWNFLIIALQPSPTLSLTKHRHSMLSKTCRASFSND